MSTHLLLTGLIWGAVAVISVLTAIAWREQGKRGATPFALAMFCGTWWATASALGLFAETGAMRVVLAKVEWAGIVYIPVAWLFFALAFTGRERYVTIRNGVFLSVVPTLTLALAMTNTLHDLVYSDVAQAGGAVSVLVVDFGPWFWVHLAFSTTLVAVGTGLIVGVALDRERLYTGQVAALLGVILPPVLAQVAYVGRVPPFAVVDPTPYAFAISGIAGIVAVRRYQFLEAAPVTGRVAKRSVLRAMDAGVLVVDGSDRVVELNPAATRSLSVEGDVIGQDAGTVIDAYEAVRSADPESPVDVSVTVDGHERHLEVQWRPLGSDGGAVLVCHDVTDRRRRIQRLAVLNRVLRHNLRNEMNVVYGYADRIVAADEMSTITPIAERIKEKTLTMTAIGDSARTINEVLERGKESADPVAIADVLEWERDRLADDHPDVDATVESLGADHDAADGGALDDRDVASDAVTCPADTATVLGILVDAVIAQNDAVDPTVRVEPTVTDHLVTFVVTDNGSGIPEMDREVLSEGTETDLRHGSGLGLWLANWGAAALDGDLTVAEEGQEVRLAVPRPEDRETAAGS